MAALDSPEPAGPPALGRAAGGPRDAALTAVPPVTAAYAVAAAPSPDAALTAAPPVTAAYAIAAAPPPVVSAPWRPWHGRARVRDLLCLAGLVLSALYGFAMIPLTPGLIATRPVLLELLSGSTSSVVAAGAFSEIESKLQLTVVVAAAVPGMMKFDLLFWWAGVLWGHRIVEMLARRSTRAAAFARRAEQRGSRFAGAAVLLSPFLPVPTPLVYAAAGWAGLGLIPFVGCDLIGSAAWAALLAVLGSLLGTSGVAAANLASRYALITMIVLAAIAIVPHAWHVLSARRR